jgi:hypothetical protein
VGCSLFPPDGRFGRSAGSGPAIQLGLEVLDASLSLLSRPALPTEFGLCLTQLSLQTFLLHDRAFVRAYGGAEKSRFDDPASRAALRAWHDAAVVPLPVGSVLGSSCAVVAGECQLPLIQLSRISFSE